MFSLVNVLSMQMGLNLDHTPKFKKPPVIETALGVQFKPLAKMRITHFGLFWLAVSPNEEFPIVEERNRLPQDVEEKDDTNKQGLFRAWISEAEELPRVLFLSQESKDGQRLIQVQPDRFLQNWRRKSLNDENYPSYKKNKEEFQVTFSKFLEFVKANKLGEVVPNQCEVTYVNRIPVDPGLTIGEMCSRCFPSLSSIGRFNLFSSEPERVIAHWSYWVEQISGRVRIDITPVVLKDSSQPIIDLRITARGAPESGDNLVDVLEWLNLGHYYVVKGFDAITSATMHERWERDP
jgi:uncharacterized protein (TIGR04255 family)